jgi:hypothetical protein
MNDLGADEPCANCTHDLNSHWRATDDEGCAVCLAHYIQVGGTAGGGKSCPGFRSVLHARPRLRRGDDRG